MTGAEDMQRMVLRETLRFAVPMHMHELQHLPVDMLPGIGSAAATVIGSHGDALQFGGKHCAEAFNALARGLAAAALTAWGGVTFDGMHWCTQPNCAGPDADHPQPYPWSPPAKTEQRPVVDLHLPDVEQAA